MLDLQNLSARRGFFDVNTPLDAQRELMIGIRERKAIQAEMRDFCLKLRDEIWEAMGRPNKKNLRNLFKYRVHTHRHADLARMYFALGDRIQEIDKIASTFRLIDKERNRPGEQPK